MLDRSMAVISRPPEHGRKGPLTLESALEGLQAAVVVLDRKGRALFVSSKAQMLISTGHALQVKGGLISAPQPLEAAALHNLVADTLMTGGGKGSGCWASPVFLSDEQGRLLRVSAIPLTVSLLASTTEPQVAALLFVRTARANARGLSEMLSRVYGLTGAEIHVALLLHAGRTPAECAREKGVSIETVRAQLKAIFQKTGVHRQPHLLHLLGELALPG